MTNRVVLAIGGSAGGFEALRFLAGEFNCSGDIVQTTE